MKKVITAIGNNILNENLRKINKYEIIGKDIQYKEGILEFLQLKNDVDVLILSELLEGQIDFKALISKILKINNKIDIIVFIENEDKEIKNFLYEKGIFKIYKNNEVNIKELENIIENRIFENTEVLNEEIKRLKRIIEEQNIKSNKNLGKITVLTGYYGCGKSILTCLLCKEFGKRKNKTLIIDFDTHNKSIPVLYNTFYKKIDYVNIKNNIIKYSNYEYLLYIEKEFLEDEKIFILINELREEYDQILIDTSGDIKNRVNKKIIEMSDNIVFIVVPTISEIKKAINFYEVLKMDLKVMSSKINLIINKDNSYSVDNLIVQKMFNIKKQIGTIMYSDNIENIIYGKIKKKIKIEI